MKQANGIVKAGKMLAIMGPTGSVKTTILKALAHRQAKAGPNTSGYVLANARGLMLQDIRKISSYLEQDDALIGSLWPATPVYYCSLLFAYRIFYDWFSTER